jgi:hypothetical protein
MSGRFPKRDCRIAISRAIAFSSDVDTGSREENASDQNPRALLLIPSKAKML